VTSIQLFQIHSLIGNLFAFDITQGYRGDDHTPNNSLSSIKVTYNFDYIMIVERRYEKDELNTLFDFANCRIDQWSVGEDAADTWNIQGG
jgi:hypothetical protein